MAPIEIIVFAIFGLFAVICGILLLPSAVVFSIGATLGAAVVITSGWCTRKSLLKRRKHREEIAEQQQKALTQEAMLTRRKEAYLILQLARAINSSQVTSVAETFVDLNITLGTVRDRLPISQVARVDHVRRTLIEIMKTSLSAPGDISDEALLEIRSSIEAGSALINATLTRLRENVEEEVTSSTAALSTQLDRMVRIPVA